MSFKRHTHRLSQTGSVEFSTYFEENRSSLTWVNPVEKTAFHYFTGFSLIESRDVNPPRHPPEEMPDKHLGDFLRKSLPKDRRIAHAVAGYGFT
jgi:hypothetical protein